MKSILVVMEAVIIGLVALTAVGLLSWYLIIPFVWGVRPQLNSDNIMVLAPVAVVLGILFGSLATWWRSNR